MRLNCKYELHSSVVNFNNLSVNTHLSDAIWLCHFLEVLENTLIVFTGGWVWLEGAGCTDLKETIQADPISP